MGIDLLQWHLQAKYLNDLILFLCRSRKPYTLCFTFFSLLENFCILWQRTHQLMTDNGVIRRFKCVTHRSSQKQGHLPATNVSLKYSKEKLMGQSKLKVSKNCHLPHILYKRAFAYTCALKYVRFQPRAKTLI